MYRFVNFKGFADATLDLDRAPVTLLIGRNGAGKSNALEGISLLGGLLSAQALTDVSDVGMGGRVQVRGGLANCVRHGCTTFRIEFTPSHDANDSHRWGYSIEIEAGNGKGSRPAVVGEDLSVAGDRLLHGTRGGPGLVRFAFVSSRVPKDAEGHEERKKNFPNTAPILSQLYLLSPELLNDAVLQAAQEISKLATAVMTINPHPAAMRGFAQMHETALQPDGANVAAVLRGLRDGSSADRARFEGIAACIKSLPEEGVDSLELIEVPQTGQVTLALAVKGRPLLSAQTLSDGTLRAIALVTAVETAPAGSLVLIEEVENGIHPSRVATVLEFCWRRAQQRGVRVLMTTHSPAVLDGLTPDQVAGVVLCWWDEKEHASKLVHLTDLPDTFALLDQGLLGNVATREAYKTRLDPDYEVKAMQRALERLTAIRAMSEESKAQ